MSFEVEIKFRSAAAQQAEMARRLAAMGGVADPVFDQEDVYLSHPARDFASSGEALRLRCEGGSNRVTYKGPRQAGPTKTREEIEIGYEEGDEARAGMRRLWERLGFRPVAVLHKQRQAFHLRHRDRPIAVVLDVADDLGAFVEIEAIAADEGDLPAAQAAVLDLAGVLGLTEVEPRSYLRMALERWAAGGEKPSGET